MLPVTKDYVKSVPLSKRSDLGQYFTPDAIRSELWSMVGNVRPNKILEPSAGTGEFANDVATKFNNAKIDLVEIDPKLCSMLVSQKIGRVYNVDFFDFDGSGYDLIVGNPPYFEIGKEDAELRTRFSHVISGRANIYMLFLTKCVESLNDGGTLAFVIPPSMNSGRYFSKFRKWLVKQGAITGLKVLSGTRSFEGAIQSVMLFVFRKGKIRSDFQVKVGDDIVFCEDAKRMKRYLSSGRSLKDYGLTAQTGKVAWNAVKDDLTDDENATLLIWSHNIGTNGRITLSDKKKQFIRKKPDFIGPALCFGRTIGSVCKAKLKVAMVNEGIRFCAENHVNVVLIKEQSQAEAMLKKILAGNFGEILSGLIGNTQISAREIERFIILA